MLLKSCLSLAKLCWAKYSEWKETIHLKQQDSQPSEQQDEDDKESEEDDKIEEKPIRRRSGRKTYQNQLRQNDVHQKDQADTGESNKISATDEEVYESGSYEDQLEAVINDLDDDSYKTASKKSSKLAVPQSSGNKTLGRNREGTTEVETVENIGAGQRANGKTHKNSKLEHKSLATNDSEDQYR